MRSIRRRGATIDGTGGGATTTGAATTPAPADGPRSRLLPGTRGADGGELVRGTARVEHGPVWTALVLGGTVVAGVAGALLVALAVRLGHDGPGHDGHGVAAALTWLGLAVGVLPALLVTLARDATGAARWTALGTVAVVTAVPVGLRAALGPATPDDLVRYAQLAALRQGAPLFADRFPTVVADQPGLPALTTAVGRVSGLTVWHSALVVLVVGHVAAVVGARALVRALGLGERLAVLAAVLWSLGPGVLVASARVDSTTLGLALLLWALAAVVQAAAAASPARRRAWTGTAVGLAAATAVTDLATAWALVGLTALVGVATVGVVAPPVSGAQVRRAWWPAGVGVLVVTVGWSVLPPGRAVLGDLRALGAQHHRAWTTGPVEVGFAVVAGVLGLTLAGFGAYRLRARLREVGPRLGLGVAALFPVSLLGLLAAPTSTLAVVVWPVLVAGVAPFAAAGTAGLWDLGARRTRSAADRSVGATLRHAQRDTRAAQVPRPAPVRAGTRDRRVPLPVAAALAVVVVGLVLLGTTTATTPSAADPVGPALGSGPVSTTALLAVADRVTALAGPHPRFVASDRALGDVLTVVTGGVDVTGVDAADVFAGRPTDAAATALRAAGVGWLVDSTPGGQDTLAVTPWLVRVLATPSVTVYRVRPAVPGAGADDDTAGDVVTVTGS